MNKLSNQKITAIVLCLIVSIGLVQAQTTTQPSPLDTVKKFPTDTSTPAPKPVPANTLTFALDMRTRAEARHGYKSIPTSDTAAAFEINQRTRFNVDYKNKNLDVFLSLQDARVWGQQDPREGQTGTSSSVNSSTTFPLYFFEAYAEPHFGDKFSVRIGRQRIMYDNQRLFAENNWRLPGNSHDAIRFIYNNRINFTNELLFSFGQSGENLFTTKFQPLVPNYKDLLVDYLNWKINDKVAFTTINTMDGYQSSKDYKKTFQRFTVGGRLEFSTYHWYLTFSGYDQFGKDSTGKDLAAFYMQPEIKYTGGPLTVRLGMEYMSGSDSSTHPAKDKSFVPLYGVAHSFMGNLDIFDVPGDFNNAGMINPYLHFMYQKGLITVRVENHLFFSQSQFVYKGNQINKYLGYENDLRLNYKPGKITDLEFGFCWAALTNSASIIKKGGDAKVDPVFGYISLRLTPTLGKITF